MKGVDNRRNRGGRRRRRARSGSGTGRSTPGPCVERLDPETGRRAAPLLDPRAATSTTSRSATARSGSRARRRASSGRSTRERTRSSSRGSSRPSSAASPSAAASCGRRAIRRASSGRSRRTAPSCRRSSCRRRSRRLTYADGALWAALGDEGTVVRIDPTTDATRDVRPRPLRDERRRARRARRRRRSATAIEDVTAISRATSCGSGGRRTTLFDSGAPTEPAFTWPDLGRAPGEFHYATCARLLNYPDAEGEAGRQLVPEVAAELPEGLGRRAYVHVQDPEGLPASRPRRTRR